MAIEGALRDVGLPDLCQLLSMGRKTGCLTLTDRSNFGYIYFRSGRVVYASVLNRPDRLGELLVKNEVITREQLSEAMHEHARDRNVRLGEVLVASGILEEDELHRFIRIQIEEAVYHLFAWNQGSFHFDPGQVPEEDGIFLVDLPAENLLLEGARRVDEWSEIEKKITSLELVFSSAKGPDEAAAAELSSAQLKVLPLVDGVRTVDDIIAESGLVEFDVGKALFGLAQAGFIEKSGRRVVADSGSGRADVEEHLSLGLAFYRAGMLEDAAQEFEAVLEDDPDHVEALHRLGLIHLREGRLEKALDTFERMPDDSRDHYAVLRNRALTLEQLARYDEALAALELADELRPGEPETTLARGIVLLRMGEVGVARETLRAYRMAPTVQQPSELYYAYAVLGAALDGQTDYALALGREGLGHHPRSGPLLVNTAGVLQHRGEGRAATALLGRACARRSAPAQAHKSLGDLALDADDPGQARSHFEKAVATDPDLGEDVYFKLGSLAWDEDDREGARLLWSRALELDPDSERARAGMERLGTEG